MRFLAQTDFDKRSVMIDPVVAQLPEDHKGELGGQNAVPLIVVESPSQDGVLLSRGELPKSLDARIQSHLFGEAFELLLRIPWLQCDAVLEDRDAKPQDTVRAGLFFPSRKLNKLPCY